VSRRAVDWVGSLQHAAGSGDERAFDAVMDQVLERARDEAGPDLGLRSLVAERLHATLAAERPGAAALERGPGARSSRATSSRWAYYGKALGLLGAGIAIGFVWGRSPLWWPAPRAVPPEAPAQSTPARPEARLAPATPVTGEASAGRDRVAPASDEARSPGTPEAPARVVARATMPRSLPAPARTVRSSDPDSLRVALEQLRKAQLLLREGEPKRALDVLDGLDARVAASVLQDEREVTRTLALCDAGDAATAGALARRFLERAPDSAYAVSLRESCAGKAALLDQMRERTSNPRR
jgi:hypothetical protein